MYHQRMGWVFSAALFWTLVFPLNNIQAQEPPAQGRKILTAYPEVFSGWKDGFLVTRDGRKLLFDDGKERAVLKYLSQGGSSDFDPEDTLRLRYRPTTEFFPSLKLPPNQLDDAGRIRSYGLLSLMYGPAGDEPSKKLAVVRFLPKYFNKAQGFTQLNAPGWPITVTRINGVDKKLQSVSGAIEQLPEAVVRQYLSFFKSIKDNGCYGYAFRMIRGTKDPSPHAFGIAVDIHGDLNEYWWTHRDKPYSYRNSVPREIAAAFEQHGFISGGQWYHYDGMHFEYRPELLIKE